MANQDRGAGVNFPPPLVYLGMLLLGPVVDWLLGLPPLPIPVSFSMIFLLPGLILIGAAIGLFRRTGENPVPSTPTQTIIDTGIYARTRNPMYLGMAIAYVGLAIILHSMPSILFLPIAVMIINSQVIAREERYLEATFGAAYAAYKLRVRRWF